MKTNTSYTFAVKLTMSLYFTRSARVNLSRHLALRARCSDEVAFDPARSRRFVGIDLGSSGVKLAYNNAVLEEDKPSVIENTDGARNLPAYTYFSDDEVTFGVIAQKKLYDPPPNVTVFSPINSLMSNEGDVVDVKKGISTLLSNGVSTVVDKMIQQNKNNYRAVFTVPASVTAEQLETYMSAVELAGLSEGVVLNDAECAVAGARDLGLLKSEKKSGVVIDVGHDFSQVTRT